MLQYSMLKLWQKPPPVNTAGLVTAEQMAEIVGATPRRVRQLAKNRAIPPVWKRGRRMLFYREDAELFRPRAWPRDDGVPPVV